MWRPMMVMARMPLANQTHLSAHKHLQLCATSSKGLVHRVWRHGVCTVPVFQSLTPLCHAQGR